MVFGSTDRRTQVIGTHIFGKWAFARRTTIEEFT